MNKKVYSEQDLQIFLEEQKKELNAKAMIGTRKLLETVVKKERERIIKELKLAKKKIIMNDQWEEKWEKGYNHAVQALNNKIDNLK